ncbi:MAG: glycoside hydrolase family 71/99-like protein [Armatimonadota bacterium]
MIRSLSYLSCFLLTGAIITFTSCSAQTGKTDLSSLTMDQVVEQTMKPYTGPSKKGVDTSTLTGKVMCGYQGWFACQGDDCGRGWIHWGPGEFRPGKSSVDLWPDMTELDADERYPTGYKYEDGRPGEVFSSFNRKTVVRHFKWMRDYGIDGAFVQRFAVEIKDPLNLRQFTTVLANCRAGANLYGRTYAVMYDMDFDGATLERVKKDWSQLVGKMKITSDPAYLHHNGHPVIALWGFGFTHRKWDTAEVRKFLDFIKNDPKSGKCTVMLGLPTGWRTLAGDCRSDKEILDMIKTDADIVSPWTVGRYGTLDEAANHANNIWAPDMKWCKENKKDYLPVVFPGFSWHNLIPDSKPNAIPRQGGKFLWKQYVEAKKLGMTMVYQAMFDEVDEGTAIFKCTNNPPSSDFITYDGLPSDHYLWLTGMGGKLIKGKIKPSETMPKRK